MTRWVKVVGKQHNTKSITTGYRCNNWSPLLVLEYYNRLDTLKKPYQ